MLLLTWLNTARFSMSWRMLRREAAARASVRPGKKQEQLQTSKEMGLKEVQVKRILTRINMNKTNIKDESGEKGNFSDLTVRDIIEIDPEQERRLGPLMDTLAQAQQELRTL